MLIAVAMAAIAWWFGASLQPLWWMTWLAALPLLVLAARASRRVTALATFAAFALGGTSQWSYLHDVLRLPLPVCLLAVLLPALLMAPPVLLWRKLVRAGRALAATFAFPLAATGLSWLSALFSPHGTFGHVAYSQMDALPVIQLAALGGPWAVGFIVWLLPSALALAGAPGVRRWRVATSVGIAVVAGALCFGQWRLADTATTATVRIGLVSISHSSQSQADIDTPEGQRLLAAYVAEIDRLAAAGARIIVAPETALRVRTHALAPLQALAERHGVRIVIGVEDHSMPPRKYNTALVFDPAPGRPARYVKRHLIPGFEDRYTAGSTPLLLDDGAGIGVAICKDFDFTAIGREYGQRHARLLLAPAWDFDVDAWLHARMAVLRGVENGFALARSARDGQLTLSDDRGRVLAQANANGNASPVTLLGELPLRATRTLYTRIGDAFGVVCLCLALVFALWPSRKPA